MKLSISSTATEKDGIWEVMVHVQIGKASMYICAHSPSRETAEKDIEKGLDDAMRYNDRLSEIWRRTGRLNWAGLET